ncbi:superoxide dismutase [Cu-Zn]-like [Brevipalpus obovatus]|uniref:superoxide dismutase [Cu-Zn]-like n=1 Tax=Brevipalpus obovatus TaxID=246614 RepID=UPI003D9FABCE
MKLLILVILELFILLVFPRNGLCIDPIDEEDDSAFENPPQATPTPIPGHLASNVSIESRRAQSLLKKGFYAEAIIRGENGLRGWIFFENSWNGASLYGVICGLRPGSHGWHIHQYGQHNGRCENAGPHFTMVPFPHAGSNDKFRHNGDLGNIQADRRGMAFINQFNGQISVSSRSDNSVLGRSILVHEWPDDLGVGKGKESQITGNSGKVIGCGLIGLRSEKAPLPTGCPPPNI